MLLVASPLLFALGACTPGTISFDSGTPVPHGDDSAGTTDSTEHLPGSDTSLPEGDDTATTEPAETWPKACDAIYDPDTLPTFELTFSDDAWGQVRSDCQNGAQTYRPVTFTYDGESVSAMARLKGNWSWSCDKMQFILSFNEEDPDARFHGLRKIVLDAPWYDHTLLHERLAFPFFEARGLPYSCANNAKLLINGQYYGVYANVERLDHEYLERNFEESDGNLYQAGTELKTNEDVADTSDLTALNNARTMDELDAVVDLDEAVSEWAAEAMLPAMDNYWAGVEINYYVYDHPSNGFTWLPYDLDITFGDAAYSDGSLVWPDAARADPILYEHSGWRKEELVKRVLADETWCNRFVEELVEARAAYSPTDMAAQVRTWDAQIAQAVADDPHKTFSTAQHDTSVAQLQAFLQTRADFVDAWLAEGDHCPAVW